MKIEVIFKATGQAMGFVDLPTMPLIREEITFRGLPYLVSGHENTVGVSPPDAQPRILVDPRR